MEAAATALPNRIRANMTRPTRAATSREKLCNKKLMPRNGSIRSLYLKNNYAFLNGKFQIVVHDVRVPKDIENHCLQIMTGT